MKNFTPLQLALYTSSIISFFFLVLSLLLSLSLHIYHWIWALALTIIVFVTSFIAFRYALENFIYRKIKLIYKSIHTLKMRNEDFPRKVNLNNDIFEEIKDEVANWAKGHKNQVEKLEASDNYRRELLGNVSHELKTPIFNIQGYLHTLIDGKLSDETINMRYLKKAAKNLDSLSDIVNDLEVISQLESGQLPILTSKFDILELINEVIESVEITAKKKKIELKIKDGCNKSQFVIADKEKIKQVLVNLTTNSIRYGKEEGLTSFGIYDMGDNILIEVSDNGLGISNEHLPHLFERFYRVDKARTRKYGGTGLGLSIVKHIIEAHDQSINVRSTVNIGSTFGFTLQKSPN